MPDIATLEIATVTIANSATTSDALNCGTGRTLVGIILPAGISGTTMTFTTATASGGTYVPVYDVGGASAYSVTIGTSRYVPLDPRVFAGCRFLKLVSGSTESGGDTITCVLRVV